MSEKGQLTRDVIDKLIVTMGDLASGANADAMQTLNGQISNLSDAWERFEDTLLGDKSEGAIKNIVGFWTNQINELTGFISQSSIADQLNEINQQVLDAQENINELNSAGVISTVLNAGIGGKTVAGEENKLRQLAAERSILIEQQKQLATEKELNELIDAGVIAQKKATDEKFKASIAAKKAADIAVKAALQQAKLGASIITGLQREIALRDDSSTKTRLSFEIAEGSLKNISTGQKKQILQLGKQVDGIKKAADEYKEFNKIVKDGVLLAKKQRDEQRELTKSLREQFKPDEVTLEKGLDRAVSALDLGIISEAEFKKITTQYGQDFNDSFIKKAEDGLDELSVFANQAARNMQDSFADFLFDPFDKGLDGMFKSFATVIARMAAEAASAQIFSAAGSAISGAGGIGGILASLFHSGGDASSPSQSRAVSPLVFAGAQRFHGGGFPSLKSDEVPAILQKGERVLSKKQVANGATNQSSNDSYNITVNVSSKDSESSSVTGQKIAASIAKAVARQEIANAARPGNQLNKTTVFS